MQLIDSKNSQEHFFGLLLQDIECAAVEEKFITVDTEFIRENLKTPLICLIQIATQNEIFIIDPISTDISFLKIIFEDKKIKKVFHSAKQDMEILSIYGISVENFYDTQVYEMLLSVRYNVSYQSIVLKYLDKKLKKSHSMSDWTRRPLSKKQLRYSVDDVFYLREVYKKQTQELSKMNRIKWLDEEFLQLVKKEDENAASYKSRNEENNKIFNQLIEWRNFKATEKKILPESIVNTNILKMICKKGAEFIISLKNSRHTKDENFKDFLYFAESIADNLEVEIERPKKNISIYLLKAILEICSQKESIAPSLIATTGDLEKLSNGYKSVKCLYGWRNDVFGRYATELLNGNIALCINDSQVAIK